MERVPLAGRAEVTLERPTFTEIHLVLDVSASMGLAADDAGRLLAINTLDVNGEECTFACHRRTIPRTRRQISRLRRRMAKTRMQVLKGSPGAELGVRHPGVAADERRDLSAAGAPIGRDRRGLGDVRHGPGSSGQPLYGCSSNDRRGNERG